MTRSPEHIARFSLDQITASGGLGYPTQSLRGSIMDIHKIPMATNKLILIALFILLAVPCSAQQGNNTSLLARAKRPSAASGGDCESAILALSPVQYLRLGESSGPTAADNSGNGNSGTYQDTPTFSVAALASNAGGDTAVELAGGEGVDAGLAVSSTSSWTFVVFYDAQASDKSIVTKGLSRSAENQFDVDAFFTTSTNLRFKLSSGASQSTTNFTVPAHSSGAHMLAVVWDETTAELYIDGSSLGTSTPGFALANSANWFVGGSGAFSFDGVLDEFALFTTDLTSGNISAISSACQ